jgi:translation initiation factor eIF-2B subunit beta
MTRVRIKNIPKIPLDAFTDPSASFKDNVKVLNPGYDYVPPELVSLFVTNMSPPPPGA